jgi:hypothetical protein
MGLRWPRSERYGAQGPPWLYPQKVQSRAVTLLGERPTGQKRTQRAASLILGQPPSPSRKEGVEIAEVETWLNTRSGLLGVSERSSDMRELLEAAG